VKYEKDKAASTLGSWQQLHKVNC